MIASLRGKVLALTATGAVIECGGVGLAVTLTPTARDVLRQGEEASLVAHLVVREDSLTLYGFGDTAERDVFVTAQSVSGIGPRLALALVSTLGADGLVRAIATEDLGALARVPGVGRKSAQKLVLALAGKLGAVPRGRSAPGAGAGAGVEAQVQAALESLGWAPALAADAVRDVLANGEALGDDVSGVLRAALRRLGGSR
ncbi:MAG: Holliday junction branch migration protein RuvA [Bifidobacteriaceae bacterium]|nr:Holliday junction branch migration protein RuvA [Bifidobacteriaceae bacterium]